MDKRIESYKDEDFEGAKIITLQYRAFEDEYLFGVVDIKKTTALNVMFELDNRVGLFTKRKQKNHFGFFDATGTSFFLQRKGNPLQAEIAYIKGQAIKELEAEAKKWLDRAEQLKVGIVRQKENK